MPTYRIYRLTDGGHIDGPPAMLNFDDDQGAVRHAQTLKDGVDLEVWEGRRRVAEGRNAAAANALIPRHR